jgi:peptidoglycan/xylan/chitin deacetylase (PgdA/CDA1 family)
MRRAIVGLVKSFSAHLPAHAPVVWSVHRHRDRVALTFDDGPTDLTGNVLDALAKAEAKATFFVLCDQVRQRPDLLRLVLDGGHEIGIHGFEHSMRNFYDQVRRCEAELSKFGAAPRLIRTPRGVIDPILTARLWRRKYSTVIWSFDGRDSMRLEGKWVDGPPDYTRVAGGDIVLLHDDNDLCLHELPVLLASIKNKNLHPVTVSELLGLEMRPDTEYALSH